MQSNAHLIWIQMFKFFNSYNKIHKLSSKLNKIKSVFTSSLVGLKSAWNRIKLESIIKK